MNSEYPKRDPENQNQMEVHRRPSHSESLENGEIGEVGEIEEERGERFAPSQDHYYHPRNSGGRGYRGRGYRAMDYRGRGGPYGDRYRGVEHIPSGRERDHPPYYNRSTVRGRGHPSEYPHSYDRRRGHPPPERSGRDNYDNFREHDYPRDREFYDRDYNHPPPPRYGYDDRASYDYPPPPHRHGSHYRDDRPPYEQYDHTRERIRGPPSGNLPANRPPPIPVSGNHHQYDAEHRDRGGYRDQPSRDHHTYPLSLHPGEELHQSKYREKDKGPVLQRERSNHFSDDLPPKSKDIYQSQQSSTRLSNLSSKSTASVFSATPISVMATNPEPVSVVTTQTNQSQPKSPHDPLDIELQRLYVDEFKQRIELKRIEFDEARAARDVERFEAMIKGLQDMEEDGDLDLDLDNEIAA